MASFPFLDFFSVSNGNDDQYEHYTFLDLIPAYGERQQEGWGWAEPALLNPDAAVGITHVVFTGVLMILLVVLGLMARKKYSDRKTALVPDGKLTVASFFEVVYDAIFNMMAEMMGEKKAKKFFPLIAALAVFIFFGNVIGLIPGLYHPTSNLNTGLACAIVVFFVYNAAGFLDQGVDYIKHFMGPVVLLAPLIFVIEIVSHAFRPVSLSVRLTGNMTGDGMMLEIFGDLGVGMLNIPFLLPIPFLFLGLLVSIIQALIFCLLATVYIGLAVDDHH